MLTGHNKNTPKSASDIRNGYSSKTGFCDNGEIELSTHRDCDNIVEPHLTKKNLTRITQWDSQILSSLNTKDIAIREIVATLQEMCDPDKH